MIHKKNLHFLEQNAQIAAHILDSHVSDEETRKPSVKAFLMTADLPMEKIAVVIQSCQGHVVEKLLPKCQKGGA